MTEAELAATLLSAKSPSPKRLSIHRNNVILTLIEALEIGFPVTRHLVGTAFFAETARTFLHQHPPRSPILALYGADFPAFLQDFAPAQSLPYLADLAALEQALRESFHAADAAPIAPTAFAGLTDTHRLTFAPALRLIRSDWPIWAIWTTKGDAPLPLTDGTDVLVLRPGFDPVPHPLPKGAGQFLSALQGGQTLGEALSITPPDINLTAVLSLLLQGNGLVSLT